MPTHEELVAYVDAVGSSADLLAPPPPSHPVREQAWWSWKDVVDDELDLGLEIWAWGLSAFGREAAARAAVAVCEHLAPIWVAAVATAGSSPSEIEANAETGAEPSIIGLATALRRWTEQPTREGAAALFADVQRGHLDFFDHVGSPELRERWDESWMFVLTATYAAAMIPGDDEDQFPRHLGNVLVSARKALAPTLGSEAPLAVWKRVRTCADREG